MSSRSSPHPPVPHDPKTVGFSSSVYLARPAWEAGRRTGPNEGRKLITVRLEANPVTQGDCLERSSRSRSRQSRAARGALANHLDENVLIVKARHRRPMIEGAKSAETHRKGLVRRTANQHVPGASKNAVHRLPSLSPAGKSGRTKGEVIMSKHEQHALRCLQRAGSRGCLGARLPDRRRPALGDEGDGSGEAHRRDSSPLSSGDGPGEPRAGRCSIRFQSAGGTMALRARDLPLTRALGQVSLLVARVHFDSSSMTSGYEDLYARFA